MSKPPKSRRAAKYERRIIKQIELESRRTLRRERKIVKQVELALLRDDDRTTIAEVLALFAAPAAGDIFHVEKQGVVFNARSRAEADDRILKGKP